MNNNFELLENFLRDKEQLKKSFTIQEVQLATEYKTSTIKAYFSKKLIGYLVYEEEKKNQYISSGICKLSSGKFSAYMSQSSIPKYKSESQIFSEKLEQRSLDAFLLAIENYNRPSLNNRVEAFSILIINAWELLLKSILVKQIEYLSIFYNGGKRSLCLRDALQKVCDKTNLLNKGDPTFKNIELLAELRDQSIHLLINELQHSLSRIFQATVLNYINLYEDVFDKFPLAKQGLGLLSLVVEEESLEYPVIASVHGRETAKEVKYFLEKFKQTETELSSNQFAIPIEYKLVLTKKESDSDIKITSGKEGQEAIVISKPRNPDETHPYRQKEVLKEINKKVKLSKPLNQHDFQALIFKHKVKGNANFHHYGKLSNTHSYSQALIDKFVNLVNSNPQSIQEAKKFYRNKRTASNCA